MLYSALISNNSTKFSFVLFYVIVKFIYNPCILSLLRNWGIIPVFTFGFWKPCICTYQTKKGIIVIVKETGPSCYLAYIGHQMQVDSTNGTLGLIHLPTYLERIVMLIPGSADLRWISICVRFPHRRELEPRRYLVSLIVFAKFFNWTSSSDRLTLSPLSA